MSGYANDQKHYVALSPIQVMQKLMTKEEFIGFCKGNAIKYILRADYKGQHDSDLEKARQYLWWASMAEQDITIDPALDIPPDIELKIL